MSNDGVSRRHFFFGSLLAGAVPLAGYGSVPSLRALGYKSFYDKLNVASIGCGGQGGVDFNNVAVTIGIPDFMHATVALACMQHGKHVYLEKPLTRTPWEACLLMEAAAK